MDEELRRIRRERWLASSSHHQPARTSDVTASLSSSSSSSTTRHVSTSGTYSASKRGNGIDKKQAGKNRRDDNLPAEDGVIDLTDSPPKKRKKKSSPSGGAATKSTSNPSKLKSSASYKPKRSGVPKPFSFSVATYNVWFGPPHPSSRMSRIASLLTEERAMKPTFVGLQEVTPQLSRELYPNLRAVGYEILTQDLDMGYGCAIAVRLEEETMGRGVGGGGGGGSCGVGGCRAKVIASGFVPYDQTIMGRGLMWVLAKLVPECEKGTGDEEEESKGADGAIREVLFTTTHLESFVPNHPGPGQTYDGAKERESQIIQAKKFCDDCLEKRKTVDAAIITGDLNWDDERKRSKGNDRTLLTVLGDGDRSHRWRDAWLETRPGEEGYTYDSKINPMLRGNLRRRFDRCLVRFGGRDDERRPSDEQGGELAIEGTEIIGQDPIEGLEWKKEVPKWGKGGGRGGSEMQVRPVVPSDHFGLVVAMGDRTAEPMRQTVSSRTNSKRKMS